VEPLTSLIANHHVSDLLREAEAERLARLLRSQRTRAAWRRVTGTTARRMSAALDDVATRLDPVCRPTYGRPSYGRE
jgi:hypothetical protein